MTSRQRGFVAVAAVSAGMFVSACGSVEPEREPASATTTAEEQEQLTRSEPTDSEVTEQDVSWSWFAFAAQPASDPSSPPLADQLAVFSRPREATDQIPPEARGPSEPEAMDFEDLTGRELREQSRLALRDVGKQKIDVYVVPTAKGSVCRYIVDPAKLRTGIAGCDRGLYRDVIWHVSGDKRSLEVEGLVGDTVGRVEVEVWGRRLEAEVGGNTFLMRTTLEKSCPEAVGGIVLHYTDGRSRVVSIPMEVDSVQGGPLKIPECR